MSEPLPSSRSSAPLARPYVRTPSPGLRQHSDRAPAVGPTGNEAGSLTINDDLGRTSASGFHLPPGGLTLGNEIGRGGLGLVREAVQRVFGRIVAVKTLHRRQADAKAVAGFYAEAVATAALQHPHIVPIIDLIDNDGELRLLMKRVEGVTWHALLHPRSAPEKELAARHGLDEHLEILGKIIDAVAFAHSRGVLHRDLKPANVMVGDYGEVLLMDWGCAVTYGEHAIPGIQPVASTTTITGSPAYLAPEMARPDPAHIGPASDVYLLGCILYEILTGQRPHAGTSVSEIIHKAVKGHIVPPAERAPDRRIPRELAGLAMLCLNPDSAKRPTGAEEVAARLKRYFRHRDALRLADQGQQLAEQAGEDLEAWGRAVSFAEQALEIWPRCPDARQLRLEAGLHYAQAAFRRGSFALAAAQAGQVQRVATEWKQIESARRAGDLAGDAAAQEQKIATRERQIARMRVITRVAVVAVVLVSLVLGTASGVAYLRMRQAQTEHAETQRQAAPAWISRASAQLERGDLNEAAVFVELAVRFNPESAPAHLLAAELAFLQGNLAAAKTSLTSASRAGQAGLDPLLTALGKLTASGKPTTLGKQTAPGKPAVPGKQGALGEQDTLGKLTANDLTGPQRDDLAKELARCGLDRAARGFFADRGKRLDMYRERCAKAAGMAVGQIGPCLTMTDAGALKVVLHSDLVPSLRCLDGLPVADLDLKRMSKITTLDALRGLPLVRLSLATTPIKDLSPLVGLPLKQLEMAELPVESLGPLRGLPLDDLSISGLSPDLSPIADLKQLKNLTISMMGNRLLDLTWLKGKPLQSLKLYAVTIESSAVLRELKIPSLNLNEVQLPPGTSFSGIALTNFGKSYATDADIAILVGSQIRDLTLVRPRGSLKALKGLKPQNLTVTYSTASISGADLVAIEPGQLSLWRTGTETGLSDLRNLKQVQVDGFPLAEFFQIGEILATITRQPCDDRVFTLLTGDKTITLKDHDLHDLRPLGGLSNDFTVRLLGCRFGKQAPLLPEKLFKSVDISFSDIHDPLPFIALAQWSFTFIGIPIAEPGRFAAAKPLEEYCPGIPLVANRTTLAAVLKRNQILESEKLESWVPRLPTLAFYEVMRLELHEGRAAALERLVQYQRCLTDPATMEIANRLRTTIEGRTLRR